jgi:hypothetical protein
MSYRFDRFRREHLREALQFQAGKDPGWPAPDFDLPTTHGGRLKKADFAGRPLLVVFASLTDPIAASAAPVLKRLHQECGHQIAFVTVYVREAHPGDHIPQPRTAEWKLRHARAYQVRDGIPWPVAVDDLDGSTHRAFGGNGASAFLVDVNGNVAFRALFSNDETGLRAALHALRSGAGQPFARGCSIGPAVRGLARYDDVLRAAGPLAVDDFRREVPLVYGAAELAWIWRTLTPLGRTVLVASAAVVIGGVVLATRRRSS